MLASRAVRPASWRRSALDNPSPAGIISVRCTPAAPSPARSRNTIPALSAFPNTDAPATRRRMSRPEAGLATIPTHASADTRKAYAGRGCAEIAAGRRPGSRQRRRDPFVAVNVPPIDTRTHVVCALMEVQADGSADPHPRAPGDHHSLAADGRRGARPRPPTRAEPLRSTSSMIGATSQPCAAASTCCDAA